MAISQLELFEYQKILKKYENYYNELKSDIFIAPIEREDLVLPKKGLNPNNYDEKT